MKKVFQAVVISFLIFTGVHAADFGGIGGKPAHPTGEHVNDKEWFFFTLNPGESKEDAIQIQNNDDVENTINFYPADSTPSTDGGFALKQKAETMEYVGKWIKFSEDTVTLPPHQSTVIPFTITVPPDSKIDVGEHTGAILMQKANETPAAVGGMQIFTRVGTRVYVTIPGEIIKKIDIAKFNVEQDDEKKLYTVSLSVKNSGNTSQDLVVKTQVTNLYPWLNSIPFIKDLYKDFPVRNVRNLQVLRDDELTSNFEFKKPFFGKFKVEGEIDYDNGVKKLTSEPVEINVGFDLNVIILLVLSAAFLVCLLALWMIKRREEPVRVTPARARGRKK